MVMPSSRSSISVLPQIQTYRWRTFFLEFLYGLLAISWYFFALPEMFLLKGLLRLGKLVAPSSNDASKDVSERGVLPEATASSFLNAVNG